MNTLGFDELARKCGSVARRRAITLLGGSLAGGVLATTSRGGGGRMIGAQDGPPVASPVLVAPKPPVSPLAPETCSYYILSGGTAANTYIHVDDDLVIFINDEPVFEDHDNITNIMPPIAFQALPGDPLTVVARDAAACGRSISALWLHCADGGDPRFLTAGRNDGCDPDRPIHENFFRERWVI